MKHLCKLFVLCLYLGGNAVAQPTLNSFFDGVEIVVSNTDINTKASDFGPAFVKNDLWYSAYPKSEIKKVLRGNSDKSFYKIFSTPIDQNGLLTSVEKIMKADFNTEFHEGPIAYNENTGELFLTLSNAENVDVVVDGTIVKRTRMRLRMVVANLVDSVWVIEAEMPFNFPAYSVGHPSLSVTGDTLFFTSDIPDQNRGKTDIYMSVRTNGAWGTPINLGDKINTPSSEMFPFYHQSGVLIFASNGQKAGKGGLDLYYSELTADGFSEAKPIQQLNTEFDDFGLILHKKGDFGYFVSNRPGQLGDDDIYQFEIIKQLIDVTGTIVDSNTGKPVDGADIVMYDCNNKVIGRTSSDVKGAFQFKQVAKGCYKVSGEKGNNASSTVEVNNQNFVELKLEQTITVKGKTFDKSTNQVLNNAVVSLTDCNGKQLNTTVSDKNGDFTFDKMPLGCYMLTAEKELYDPASVKLDEKLFAELKLSPVKMIEVVVLDFDEKSPIQNVTVAMDGKEPVKLNNDALFKTRFDMESSISLDVKAEGYLNQTHRLNTSNRTFVRDTVWMMKREMDRTFVLDNIYYDLGKWNILPSSAIELDKLVAILKDNPTIIVELGSHTDSRGSDEANMLLSQRRSESAVSYIVGKNIPKSQIVAKGYGETKLVNHCGNGISCKEEEHRVNRRTEFKIIGM
ncbi:MAG: OmpA family protein [Prolixibacteraceae bacterium]|nr:OmpA family protein [Prolixibacteraceae bacterium]